MAGYIGTKSVLLSTTAASVTGNADIGGDLTVDTSTLFVDSTNNRVGIETTSPDGKLDIALGSMDIVAGLGGNFPMWTYRNGSGSWFHAGKHPTDDAFIVATGATPTSTERMRIDALGNLLVGTTSQIRTSSNPSVQIESAGGEQLIIRHASAAAGNLWRFTADSNNTVYILNQNTTGVYIANGGTSWVSLSDERHKDIIEPITNASSKLASLRAVIGKYKTDEEGKRRSFLIAQDVQSVLPEAVHAENPDQLGLSYTDTIPLLTAALQEALNEIAALKDRVAALEAV